MNKSRFLIKRVHNWLRGFLLAFVSAFVFAEPIHIYTENYPPYNYSEDGIPKGLSTDIIKRVMEIAGIDYTIEFLPWARAMITVEREPDSYIYSMRRLPSREQRFLWVGSIVSSYHSIFALKGRTDLEIEDLNELKEYDIGTTIYDSRETLLINMGFPLEKLTRISGIDAYERNYMKLKAGRIDAWPIDDAVAAYISRKHGDDPTDTLKKIYVFNKGHLHPYYLGANLNSNPEIVQKISETMTAFVNSPEYIQILKSWGVDI